MDNTPPSPQDDVPYDPSHVPPSESGEAGPSKPDGAKSKREPRYFSGAHTKHRLLFHIVFLPKYRKRMLEGSVKARLERLIEQCCEVNDWSLEEMNVQADHVHLLLQLPPTMCVCDAVKRIKGGSSRVLRSEFGEELEEFLWGRNFWSAGYFAESVGRLSESAIRDYVRDQDKKRTARDKGEARD